MIKLRLRVCTDKFRIYEIYLYVFRIAVGGKRGSFIVSDAAYWHKGRRRHHFVRDILAAR